MLILTRKINGPGIIVSSVEGISEIKLGRLRPDGSIDVLLGMPKSIRMAREELAGDFFGEVYYQFLEKKILDAC